MVLNHIHVAVCCLVSPTPPDTWVTAFGSEPCPCRSLLPCFSHSSRDMSYCCWFWTTSMSQSVALFLPLLQRHELLLLVLNHVHVAVCYLVSPTPPETWVTAAEDQEQHMEAHVDVCICSKVKCIIWLFITGHLMWKTSPECLTLSQYKVIAYLRYLYISHRTKFNTH